MERTVGVFFFVGILALGMLSFWVDDEGLIFGRKDRIVYLAVFESVEGLREGDPVYLQGYMVGRIEEIKVVGGEVEVAFNVKKGYRLKKDSEAVIGLANLLGGSRLNLTAGTPGAAILPPGGRVYKATVGAGLSSIIESADAALSEIKGVVADSREDIRDTIKHVRSVAQKINEGEGTVGKLINDPELHDKVIAAVDEIKAGMENFKEISAKIKEGEGFLAKLVNDEQLFKDLTETVAEIKAGMANFRKISDQIAEGKGTVGKLVMEEDIHKELKGALETLRAFGEKISEGKGTIAQLVNDPAVYEQLSEAIATVNRVVKKIDSGEGTIAKLVNDPALYDEARKLFSGLGEAVEDAREQAPISAFSSVIFGAFQ